MHRPGACRAARPARWSADARLIDCVSSRESPENVSKNFCLTSPVSTTARTPGMVSELSATFVEKMRRRLPPAGRVRMAA